MGRLSHLTTVGLRLVQTQTWRVEDYRRLFEHLSRRLFKEGIIRNIQQYLSALCKESYPCPPPRGTLSLTSLPPRSPGRLRTRFREGHLPISVSRKTQKAERLSGTCDGLSEKRPYRWHRCVCFLHGCMFNDEWFPRCRVPANEAVSYSLLGVMGAGETPATWQRRETGGAREWKVASHDIPKHGDNQMPSINNSFLNRNEQIAGDVLNLSSSWRDNNLAPGKWRLLNWHMLMWSEELALLEKIINLLAMRI